MEMIIVLLAGLFIGIALYYLRLYRHPTVQRLSANPLALMEIPLEQIKQTHSLLKQVRYLEVVLSANNITEECLEQAVIFLELSNSAQSKLLANRLNAEVFPKGLFFSLRFNENTFPLKLSQCSLYFPLKRFTGAQIKKELQENALEGQIIIIISLDGSQREKLREFTDNRATSWAMPSSQELTRLLIHQNPTETLVNLLANQLERTRISPYITQSGSKLFFGREKILTTILQSKPKNYIIFGGRQLGKTSLLQKIDHYYNAKDETGKNIINTHCRCYYLPLSGDNLQESLARALRLPSETDMDTLLRKLGQVPQGSYRLVLIDESDKFIRKEIAEDYPTLHYFRSLSEQGFCHFIFAGFWDLYVAATLDFKSPLKFFGEPIPINELEEKACRQLATEPMKMLGIQYKSPELVESIIKKTGQRANLIAIICDEILKEIPNDQAIITVKEVEAAINSNTMHDALQGWQVLTDRKEDARLDRVILYATVKKGEFTRSHLVDFLDKLNYSYSPEQLNESLMRLQLAFMIKEITEALKVVERKRTGTATPKNYYRYCVPLFREMMLQKDLTSLLKDEVRQSRKSSPL